jgi:hypothetical protein
VPFRFSRVNRTDPETGGDGPLPLCAKPDIVAVIAVILGQAVLFGDGRLIG